MKKVYQWLIVSAVILIFVGSQAQAKWYQGIFHIHSTFSDGDRTPTMLKRAAKANGCDFLIVTDHLDQIDKKKKGLPRADLFTDDFGYDNYINQFSVEDPLLCLAGTEIATSDGSHILAIANNENIKKVFEADLNKVDQQEVVTRLNKLDARSIAAHPSIKKYQFNQDKADGLCGIEFFNEDAAGYKKTLEWYLKLVAAGKSPFVTSGCDSHTSVDPTSLDLKRWQRKTFVWVDGDLMSKSLIESITAGQTYAANDDIRLKGWFLPLNYINQKTESPFDLSFRFQLQNPPKKSQSLRVVLYRDGLLLKESTIKLSTKSDYEYFCFWRDDTVASGKHSYIFEIEGKLITSPIQVDIKQEYLETNGITWSEETIDKLFPTNRGQNNYPADQAYDCVKGFFAAFNRHNDSQEALNYIIPDSHFVSKDFVEMSTGKYWKNLASDATRPENIRENARQALEYIRQHGLPTFSLDKSVIVTVDKENKQALVFIENYETPPPILTDLSHTQRILACCLKRNDRGEFMIVTMSSRSMDEFKVECDRALGKTLAKNYKYNRKFSNLR